MMNQEGDKGMESGLSSEDALSPRSGKRLRDEKEEVLLSCVKAKDSDVTGTDGNTGEDQATPEENLINSQSGKRIKCDGDTKKVATNIAKKDQTLTSEVEEDTPFFCSVCSVTCTSKKDYDTHIAGKRHARAVTGVVTPRSGKAAKKSGTGSKTKMSPATLHEEVPMKQQVTIDDSTTDLDQAGKGHASSCTACTDLDAADLQAFKGPNKNGSKDIVGEQQDLKEGVLMESLGTQVLKNGSTSKVTLHDQGNENFVLPLTNGHHAHNTSADGFAKCNNNIEGQNNKSILDLARCKSSSDGIARALAAAYQACACPGLEGLLKSGIHEQAAWCAALQAAGTASPNMTGGMVSMHTHCFMNLLHDVQVKGMEDLFLHVIREEKGRGFTMEPRLPNGDPISAMPPGEKDLNCTVCRVEYGSKSDLDRHIAGRKHTSLVTRLHSRCHLCNINCNSEKDFEKHVSGKKHASKLRLVQKRVAI